MVDLTPKQFLGGPPPLGEILVSQGLIQKDQLFQALAHKNEHGLFLGQALVALRFVTEEDLVRALRSQQRVDAIHLTPDIVDHEVAAELGYEKCNEFGCIPVNRIAGHITVAMENPSDLLSVQELTGHMKARLLPVFAEPRRIQEALRVHFNRTVSQMSSAELARRVDQLSREASINVGDTTPSDTSKHEDPIITELVEALLEEAFGQVARSIHIEPTPVGVSVRYRRGEALDERCTLPLGRAGELVGRLRAIAQSSSTERGGPHESRVRSILGGREVELCVTTAQSVHGDCAVVDIFENPRTEENLESTGLTAQQHEQLLRICRTGWGLVLAAGPVRSGKSSLTRGLLAELNHPERKFIALDDRAGSPLADVMQLVCSTEHGRGYAETLRGALRMDPDVLYVGELRDQATAELAMQAALAGCLVLSTTNSYGALDAIARLRALAVEPQFPARSLRAVVGQRLLRRLCPDCAVKGVPEPEQLERLDAEFATTEFHSAGQGCDTCRGTGYDGRVGLYELLEVTPALTELLSAGAPLSEVSRCAYEAGFVDLHAHGLHVAREGLTSLAEVLAKTAKGSNQ